MKGNSCKANITLLTDILQTRKKLDDIVKVLKENENNNQLKPRIL
jgi:hypothetical protein